MIFSGEEIRCRYCLWRKNLIVQFAYTLECIDIGLYMNFSNVKKKRMQGMQIWELSCEKASTTKNVS